MTPTTTVVIILIVVAVSSWIFTYLKLNHFKSDIKKKEEELNNRMYELAILKELGDRVGYSLDVNQIVDIITGSLHQFIEYSAVSYMLIEPEKVLFKVHLEESVHRGFVDDVKRRMLGSLSALLGKELSGTQVEEVLSGAILIEDLEMPVQSFFNIPIVIGEKILGVLTVAHTEPGHYKEDEMTILYKITNQASQQVTRLQEVVSTEQGKLNAMVESMADGIVMTDLDYRVLVINPAAKEAIGFKGKDDVTIFDFIDNLGGKFDIRGKLEESVKLKKNYLSDRIELAERFFQIFVFPVANNSATGEETVLGGVVIFHDITSEVATEQLQKDFTSMLVHELRSPLDGIKRISSVLKKKTVKPSSEKFDEYLTMIYKNSSGMLTLVSDILDVAKIEAGKFTVTKKPWNIKELVANRIEFYSIIAKDSGISLSANFLGDVPQTMDIDPEGIEHVLNNLLSNALKFTKDNGEVKLESFIHHKSADVKEEMKAVGYTSKTFELKKTYEHDSLVVALSDTGVGLKEEEIGTLFRKFKQAGASSTTTLKGTGLGLVISKGIVEGHGGEIGVVSEFGAGTTFYFTLPLAK